MEDSVRLEEEVTPPWQHPLRETECVDPGPYDIEHPSTQHESNAPYRHSCIEALDSVCVECRNDTEGTDTTEEQSTKYPEFGAVEEWSNHSYDSREAENDTDRYVSQLSGSNAVEEVVDPGNVATDDEECYAAVIYTQTQHVHIVGVTHQSVETGGEQETGDGAQNEEGDDDRMCPSEIGISCSCVSRVREVRNEEYEYYHA